MKLSKFIYIFLLLSYFSIVCFAQTDIPDESTYLKQYFKTNFYVLNTDSQGMLITQDFILAENHLNMKGLSKEEMTKRYRIKYPAILITPKAGTKFLTLNQLYEKFNIASSYRNYVVRIDNSEVVNPATLLAADGAVRNVLIDKERKIVHIITTNFENAIRFNKNKIASDKNVNEAMERAKREGRDVIMKKEGNKVIFH